MLKYYNITMLVLPGNTSTFIGTDIQILWTRQAMF